MSSRHDSSDSSVVSSDWIVRLGRYESGSPSAREGSDPPLDAPERVVTRGASTAPVRRGPGKSLSRLLTVKELAELLQVPVQTIYTWRYKRIGPPAVPMGKYLRFRPEDVAAWLDSRADAPLSGPGKRSQLGSRVTGGAA